MPSRGARVGEKIPNAERVDHGIHVGSRGSNPFERVEPSTMYVPPMVVRPPVHSHSHPRKARPSDFQKWVKKFDGSGDPHNHMANFRQVLRGEQIHDWHTQFEGFGMTLDSIALTWFQTIEPGQYHNLETMEKDFIKAFSKMGIKHNTVALIYNFKQKDRETMRQCSYRLKQYIARCPEIEIPSQERLVSLFLEGLVNKTLHANLYSQKYKNLNACIREAIDVDDNCEIFKDGVAESDTSSQRSETFLSTLPRQVNVPKAIIPTAQELADEVVKRLSMNQRPPLRTDPLRPTNTGIRPQVGPVPRQWKWCNIENKWTNHKTHECYYRPRNKANFPPMPAQIPPQPVYRHPGQLPMGSMAPLERPQPVLGQQPPLPGANQQIPVRYVSQNEGEIEKALVPVSPYNEEVAPKYYYEGQGMNEPDLTQPPPLLDIGTLLYMATNQARQQMRPQAQLQKRAGCFTCGAEDHWAKDCPLTNKQLRPLQRFCDECMFSHLINNCPKNPRNASAYPQDKEKAPLQVVTVIPSTDEEELEIPILVVTRAQAKQNDEIKLEEILETKKQKHLSWRKTKSKMGREGQER